MRGKNRKGGGRGEELYHSKQKRGDEWKGWRDEGRGRSIGYWRGVRGKEEGKE